MAEEQDLTIRVTLPANRDFEGIVSAETPDGVTLAGPFRIAARAADDIAAAHGNPTRATTLPFGDPPLGVYRVQGVSSTGEGTRYREDLFGTQDVLVLQGTGGHAALADANGRFEILIHGGALAVDGHLRMSSGHFRVQDSDLSMLINLVRRARKTRCICEPVPGETVPIVSGSEICSLPESEHAGQRRAKTRLKSRPAVAWDSLVAFGEYSADAGQSVPLNSPIGPPAGQSGLASMGVQNISDRMQLGVAQSLDSTVNPYTGAQPQPSPLTFDPYPGGPSSFYPWGQPANAFNSAASAPTGTSSSGNGSGSAGSSRQSGGGSGSSTSAAPPMMFPYGPPAVGLQSYVQNSGLSSDPFINSAPPASPVSSSTSGMAPPVGPPNLEMAGAWSRAFPSPSALPFIAQGVQYGFLPAYLGADGVNIATSTAQTDRSIVTATRSQTGEISPYDARKTIGQIGLIAPSGSNIPGLDFVTITVEPNGDYTLNIADAKIRIGLNSFGSLNISRRSAWLQAVQGHVDSLDQTDPGVQKVQDALKRGAINWVRDTVDFSNRGQGQMQLAGQDVEMDPPLKQQPTAALASDSTASSLSAPGDNEGDSLAAYLNKELGLDEPLSQLSLSTTPELEEDVPPRGTTAYGPTSGAGTATIVGTMVNMVLPSLNLGDNPTQALSLAVLGASEWVEMLGPAVAGTALVTAARYVGPQAGLLVAGATDAVGAAFGAATVTEIAGLSAGAIGVASGGVALAGAFGYAVGTGIEMGLERSGVIRGVEKNLDDLGFYDWSYRTFFK